MSLSSQTERAWVPRLVELPSIGDRVTWLHEPRLDYGYQMSVAGVVTQVNASRIQIRVARRVSRAEYLPVLRWVDPMRLSPRTETVREVDDPTAGCGRCS